MAEAKHHEIEIDIQKIQVLVSFHQGWFNFRATIVASGLIGALILVSTMYYEKIIPFYGLAIGYLVIFLAGFYMSRQLMRDHEKHVSFISGLMLKIEKGERLDSIEKLRQEYLQHHQNTSE
jgi:hypothetical protein